ncbi:hypothetical protein AC249_AIPGENE7545 [Exaiptasia diaphana]|nr:hypothetical protein AC249_AIPGENE7545 [Exaiptasia diaphana]
MAVSIDELNLDFGHDNSNTKSSERQSLFFGRKKPEGKPENVLEPRILENKLNLSTTRNKQQPGSLNEVVPSSTAAEMISRVGAAIDKERKIWMGQNALDQRQNSYTSLTRESYSQLSTDTNRTVMSLTGAPLPRTNSKMAELFGNDESKLQFDSVDSPFMESNPHCDENAN